MLLYYISSKSKKNIFDAVCEQNNIYVQHFDVAETYNLKEFVRRNNTLINAEYFVIDLTDGDFTSDNVLDCAETFKKLYKARLIFISPKDRYIDVFAKLSDKGINNLITITDNTDLQKEFEVCISENGKTYLDVTNIRNDSKIEVARQAARPMINIKDGSNIKVGIAGTDIRVGVTTQCFAVNNYLKWLGFESCYVDLVGKQINSIVEAYEDKLIDKTSYFVLKKCNISSKIPDDNCINASVIDFGVLTDDNIASFSECDIKLVVSGSKPWELKSLSEAFNNYPISNDIQIFSFASDDDKENIKELFEDVTTPYYFAPYQTNIFKLDNTNFYSTMLLSTIKQIAED